MQIISIESIRENTVSSPLLMKEVSYPSEDEYADINQEIYTVTDFVLEDLGIELDKSDLREIYLEDDIWN